MEQLIYTNDNSLSSELCDEIIDLFEKQEYGKYEGLTRGGVQKNIKDTVDFVIPQDEIWKNIEKCLARELQDNLKIYADILNAKYNDVNADQQSDATFKLLHYEDIIFREKIIKKYTANVGRYVYHNDFSIDYEKKEFRKITFLWYLNDVIEGGETDFFAGDIKIRPKKGTLIFFPSSWTYPHSGKMPMSSNKYIITGWLYNKY